MRRAGLVILLVAAFVAVWYAVRDASLDVDRLSIDRASLPDLSLERVEFQREEDGVEWKASAGLVERRGEEIRLVSLDVSAAEEGRGSFSLISPAGVFSEKERTALLTDVRGSMAAGEATGYFEAPEATWTDGEREVVFAKGASFRSDGIVFEGSTVRVTFSGVFSAEKGASFSWSPPEKQD